MTSLQPGGWTQLGILMDSQVSTEHYVNFQIKKHSKEKWMGEQRKQVGRGKELGWIKCKVKEMTKWWNWNLLKMKTGCLRPFVFVQFLFFLPLFPSRACSHTNIYTEYLIPLMQMNWCSHFLVFSFVPISSIVSNISSPNHRQEDLFLEYKHLVTD